MLVPAIVFGSLGYLLAFWVISQRGEIGDWQPIMVSAALSASLLAAVLWRLLAGRERRMTRLRGGIAGACTGLFAHPMMWYVAFLWRYLIGGKSSLGDTPADPVQAIAGSLALAFISLLAAGWLTVPAGALAGWLLAHFLGGARRPDAGVRS